MSKSGTEHTNDVVQYYNDTRKEFRLIWKSNASYGLHFGYYNETINNHSAAVLEINRKMADRIAITNKDIVLDAGCGIGGSSIYLAKHYGCRAIGLNITPWQVKKARELARKNKVEDSTEFRLESFAESKLEDGSVTVFWGHEAIVHAEDKQAVLKEAYRLLKPGGRLIIVEYMLKEEKFTSEEQTLIRRLLDGWSMPNLLRKSEYASFAKKAGFENIQFENWTEPAMPSFDRLDRYARLSRKWSKFLKAIHFVNDGELANLDGTEALLRSLRAELWTYEVMTATK